jgi:anti-sigma regulatory factor (Ser/Thr protein kinase)
MSDHGPGIPALTLPDVALRRGYSTAGTLGMGYKIMISFVDKVYLATGPKGTTVAVEMKLQPEEPSIADIGWVGAPK